MDLETATALRENHEEIARSNDADELSPGLGIGNY
jgi:hypothetical protein